MLFDHLQPNKVRNEVKELRMLCAEDETSRTCWMTAFRLFKVGSGTPFLEDGSVPFSQADLETALFPWFIWNLSLFTD